jgi:hypothetical protein
MEPKKMATTINSRTGKVTVKKMSAVKRRAQDLGLTPEKYLQQLIEDDLAVSAKARSRPLDELAAPFREAFEGLRAEELDRRVRAARTGRRNGSSRQRR